MSTLKSPGLVPNQSAFEVDMRNLLRAKRANGSAKVSPKAKSGTLNSLLRSLRYRFSLFRKSIV